MTINIFARIPVMDTTIAKPWKPIQSMITFQYPSIVDAKQTNVVLCELVVCFFYHLVFIAFA